MHGNNDTASAVEAFRRADVTIHRRGRELLGHRFVGFGGDGTAPHDTELAEGESLELRLAGAIFLTHVPPRTRLPLGPDRPPGPLPRPAGTGEDPVVAAMADEPRAHICGHIHSTEGVAYLGRTKIVKLGAAMWNRCALLDLDTLRAQFLDLAPGAARQGRRLSTRP